MAAHASEEWNRTAAKWAIYALIAYIIFFHLLPAAPAALDSWFKNHIIAAY